MPSRNAAERTRCAWSESHELLRSYHDEEWGVPIHDERQWYEKLVLDGAQAGLSWLTILKKREGYRAAFANFDVRRVARYGAREEARLLADAGIVRNRAKVRSAIQNARAFLELQRECGSFDAWVWSFVDGKPLQNRWEDPARLPARSELSDRISKDLRKRGFSFVGTTIVYAFLQASGVVNDHAPSCYRRKAVARLR
jgi:DNA-3-methyladenine glycosylase I